MSRVRARSSGAASNPVLPGSGPLRGTNRRDFLRALGAATMLPLAAALPSLAQAPPAAPAPPAPSPAPTPAADKPPDPEQLADAAESRDLLEILRRRFPDRFDAAQQEAIRSDLEDGVRAGRALRALSLANSDEAPVVFRALRPEV